jgi:hypothetical protein
MIFLTATNCQWKQEQLYPIEMYIYIIDRNI